jgi:hypothetical protein
MEDLLDGLSFAELERLQTLSNEEPLKKRCTPPEGAEVQHEADGLALQIKSEDGDKKKSDVDLTSQFTPECKLAAFLILVVLVESLAGEGGGEGGGGDGITLELQKLRKVQAYQVTTLKSMKVNIDFLLKKVLLHQEHLYMKSAQETSLHKQNKRPDVGFTLAPLHSQVVMGLAFGYSGGAVRTFVESLRATGYCGDIIFGVTTRQCVSGEFARIVAEQQVQLRFVEKEENLPLASSRMHWYSEWLKDYKENDWVMVADVRDVFFQQHPFQDVATLLGAGKKDLILFYEPFDNIKQDPVDSQWIRGCWGVAALKKIEREKISCSGVTFGTKAGVNRYFREMAVEYRCAEL